MAKYETDVLVVGAGPVGQLTALRLANNGVRVTILDKHWRIGAHSYALALHAESLRLLDDLGVLSEIIEHGRRIGQVSFYQGERRVCEMSYSGLGGKFPFVLVLPQSLLESALEKRLLENKVKILWNHRLEELGVADLRAEIAKLDRVACGYPIAQMEWVVVKTFEARSSFVVGADGYHSVIREKLGVTLEQVAAPQAFSVFEFDSAEDPGSEVRIVLDDDATSVLWPMKGRRCRWSFQIPSPDQHQSTRDHLNGLIRQRAPWFPPVEGEIHWASSVMFAQRLAGSFGRDRIWLVGDSAHLTSPVGVQSMNAGLLEGDDLAGRLTRLVRKEGLPGLLEEYASQHLARWRFLLGLDGKLTPASGTEAWVTARAARILSSTPATGKDLARLLEQVGLRAPTG